MQPAPGRPRFARVQPGISGRAAAITFAVHHTGNQPGRLALILTGFSRPAVAPDHRRGQRPAGRLPARPCRLPVEGLTGGDLCGRRSDVRWQIRERLHRLDHLRQLAG